MIGLGIIITMAICAIGCVGIISYFRFKETELEYELEKDKCISGTTNESLKLEAEKEKTKQLEIKTNYREKYNSSLY